MDLALVLTADFFKAAEYYFEGVWSNVTEAERALMTRMAQRKEPWSVSELTIAGNGPSTGGVVGLLKRHDLVVEDADSIRFASELLRRWVAQSAH